MVRIHEEQDWRQTPPSSLFSSRAALSRWKNHDLKSTLRVESSGVDEHHIVSLILRKTTADLSHGSKLVHRGELKPGTLVLSGPRSRPISGTFYESFDHFRVYLPQGLIAECCESISGAIPDRPIELLGTVYTKDRYLLELMRALVGLDSEGGWLGPGFVDAVAFALSCRLVALGQLRPPRTLPVVPLAFPALNRVLEFIEANIGREIQLSEIANLSGMTRVNFSRQFKAATGQAPYRYILSRRIEKAKSLLLNGSMPLSVVALEAGFCSQPHLTTAFKKLTGTTPSRWRVVQEVNSRFSD
ncbi:helix-turn-helix domain-containing protein [Bradyrhizobium sp. STM 3557]|jgi:AraC-like DNA-binding protein|uniref:helix-turn-helix domain-containing protein n=1 Tax=Bradyrhizobium sp. STM 3557 TaxID=578920 RepID=UPI00388EAD9E